MIAFLCGRFVGWILSKIKITYHDDVDNYESHIPLESKLPRFKNPYLISKAVERKLKSISENIARGHKEDYRAYLKSYRAYLKRSNQ
jgi:hypothetical protein